MAYHKTWKNYEEQLGTLIARGMQVTDRERALDHIERLGYYRLSGYWFSFRERSEPLYSPSDFKLKQQKSRDGSIVLAMFALTTAAFGIATLSINQNYRQFQHCLGLLRLKRVIMPVLDAFCY